MGSDVVIQPFFFRMLLYEKLAVFYFSQRLQNIEAAVKGIRAPSGPDNDCACLICGSGNNR
jgi:hypothetical protein